MDKIDAMDKRNFNTPGNTKSVPPERSEKLHGWDCFWKTDLPRQNIGIKSNKGTLISPEILRIWTPYRDMNISWKINVKNSVKFWKKGKKIIQEPFSSAFCNKMLHIKPECTKFRDDQQLLAQLIVEKDFQQISAKNSPINSFNYYN